VNPDGKPKLILKRIDQTEKLVANWGRFHRGAQARSRLRLDVKALALVRAEPVFIPHYVLNFAGSKLGEMGIRETPENIANKISRGGFTAVFFIQCLRAIGVRQLNIED
jgi:hypothetical protein